MMVHVTMPRLKACLLLCFSQVLGVMRGTMGFSTTMVCQFWMQGCGLQISFLYISFLATEGRMIYNSRWSQLRCLALPR